MIAPDRPAATMRFATAWAQKQLPFRLTPSTKSQSVSRSSRNGMRGNPPALLTKTSIGPSSPSTAATIASTSASRATSARTVSARRPPARISSAIACAALSSSSQLTATSAPAAAQRSAIARPIPCCAPVTRTILPDRSILSPPHPPSASPRAPFPAVPERGLLFAKAGRRSIMGMLVNGIWFDDDPPAGNGGQFLRPDSIFRDRVTRDGSSGFKAEAGRYQLVTAPSCPWAHRTVLMRKLKGLDGAIALLESDLPKGEGWAYSRGFDDLAPKGGAFHVHQVYTAAKSDYTGRATVPVLWG